MKKLLLIFIFLFNHNNANAIDENQYIVVFSNEIFKESNNDPKYKERVVKKVAQEIIKSTGAGDYTKILHGALNGFVLNSTDEQIKKITQDKRVLFSEIDGEMSIKETTTNPESWGLDRIDQRELPLSSSFTYPDSVIISNAYVIDTGVRVTHNEFEGRAQNIFNAVDQINDDCNGHGTHVAATIAGKKYGISKNSNVFGVKVLNCDGSGNYSSVINGINKVFYVFQKPGVVNMSLGGSKSQSVNLAVENAVDQGIPFVVAAGNKNVDACKRSPASAGKAITVAASESNDNYAPYSNRGSCVDIIAPGTDIKSAGINDDNSTRTISGTSMASPHIAGISLLILSHDKNLSPNEIWTRVKQAATTNKINNVPSGTPNLLGFFYPSEANVKALGCNEASTPSKFGNIKVQLYCENEIIPISTNGTIHADSYFVGLSEFNPVAWTDQVIHNSSWVCSNCTIPTLLAANDFLLPANQGFFETGKIYKFKLAVGPVWHSREDYFKIESCIGTDPGTPHNGNPAPTE